MRHGNKGRLDDMAEDTRDLFISYAGADKAQYVQPLADRLVHRDVSFWLDNLEIAWGDSIPLRINEGLRRSRYVLVCLSEHFLRRPWPEAEIASALAIQNDTGQKRVLPLMLNSRDLVLKQTRYSRHSRTVSTKSLRTR